MPLKHSHPTDRPTQDYRTTRLQDLRTQLVTVLRIFTVSD